MSERIYVVNGETGEWIDLSNQAFADVSARAWDMTMREAFIEEIEQADEIMSESQFKAEYDGDGDGEDE